MLLLLRLRHFKVRLIVTFVYFSVCPIRFLYSIYPSADLKVSSTSTLLSWFTVTYPISLWGWVTKKCRYWSLPMTPVFYWRLKMIVYFLQWRGLFYQFQQTHIFQCCITSFALMASSDWQLITAGFLQLITTSIIVSDKL